MYDNRDDAGQSLLEGGNAARRGGGVQSGGEGPSTTRGRVHTFLEAYTPVGRVYEAFTIFLIVVNVIAFVVGTVFVPNYNPSIMVPGANGTNATNPCGLTCDTIFFGNDDNNSLGGSSVLEILTVAVRIGRGEGGGAWRGGGGGDASGRRGGARVFTRALGMGYEG
jgi:hypothetical protein